MWAYRVLNLPRGHDCARKISEYPFLLSLLDPKYQRCERPHNAVYHTKILVLVTNMWTTTSNFYFYLAFKIIYTKTLYSRYGSGLIDASTWSFYEDFATFDVVLAVQVVCTSVWSSAWCPGTEMWCWLYAFSTNQHVIYPSTLRSILYTWISKLVN